MKDSELRGYLLQYFYDRRREGELVAPKAADLGVEVDQQDIFRVCSQLGEQKLLNWKVLKIGLQIMARSGRISVSGVNLIEGNVTPAVKVEVMQHNNNTVTITGSTNVNNIIGSNNTLTLSELAKAIESADAPQKEKEEAKTLFRKLLEHPLVSALAGGAVSLLGS